jgi:hypothetical protein
LVRPLTKLTYKDKKFKWSVKAEEAFYRLKKIFVTALALAQFDYDKKTQIKTDLLRWCISKTLQQLSNQGLWVLCAFYSKKNNFTECNYEIYNKEMLMIIRYLKE